MDYGLSTMDSPMNVRVRFAPGSTRGRLTGGPLLTMGHASNHPEQATNEVRSASKDKPATSWVVYMLRCSDQSLYVGITGDLDSRVREHNLGRGPMYTAFRRPVRLIYSEVYQSRVSATQREVQIKRWTHSKKLALAASCPQTLHQLSKSRD